MNNLAIRPQRNSSTFQCLVRVTDSTEGELTRESFSTDAKTPRIDGVSPNAGTSPRQKALQRLAMLCAETWQATAALAVTCDLQITMTKDGIRVAGTATFFDIESYIRLSEKVDVMTRWLDPYRDLIRKQPIQFRLRSECKLATAPA